MLNDLIACMSTAPARPSFIFSLVFFFFLLVAKYLAQTYIKAHPHPLLTHMTQ